jgi:hypothetical protein
MGFSSTQSWSCTLNISLIFYTLQTHEQTRLHDPSQQKQLQAPNAQLFKGSRLSLAQQLPAWSTPLPLLPSRTPKFQGHIFHARRITSSSMYGRKFHMRQYPSSSDEGVFKDNALTIFSCREEKGSLRKSRGRKK